MTSVRAIAWISGLALACGGAKDRGAPPPRVAHLEIVYDVDLAKAIDDRARSIRSDLDGQLADRAIAAAITLSAMAPDTVTITPSDPATHAAITALVTDAYGQMVEARSCPAAASPAALCFGITARAAEAIEEAALEAAVKTIRKRLDTAAVVEPSVRARGDQIVVEVQHDAAGVATMKSLLGRTGVLELKGVDEDSAFMRSLIAWVDDDPEAAAAGIAFEVDSWESPAGVTHVEGYLRAADRGAITGRQTIERYLGTLATIDPRFTVPDDRAIGYQRFASTGPGEPPRWRTYYLERAAALTGSAIRNAEVMTDLGSRPAVLVDFDRDGRRVLDELTTRLVGHKLAVILDDRIASAPIVTGPIGGGRASITMGEGTPEEQLREAAELVVVLRTGSLPAPLREVSSTIVP